MPDIRAAFFDIDGTLLSHRTGRIPDSTIRALMTLHEKGILLFIATGRHFREMQEVKDLLSLPWDGFVTLDGQYCRDREEAYFKNPLDRQDVENLIRCTEEMNISCMFVEENEMYLNRSSERVRKVQADIHLPPVPVRDLARGVHTPVYLAATYCSVREQEELMKNLRFARSARWHPFGYDIFHRDGGKDVGISKSCERFGFRPEETIAFGDSENDLELLVRAGIGVALGNAQDEVKAVSDMVTADIDDDGVEKALRALGLI